MSHLIIMNVTKIISKAVVKMNQLATENNSLDNEGFLLKELLHTSNHSIKFIKNSYLFQEGMPAPDIFIVQSGKVQISKISSDGRELSLRICSADDIIGELSLFAKNPKYLLTAKALENGEAAVINKNHLEEQFLHNSKLSYEFMKWMSNQFRKTQLKLRDLILHGKKGALYSTLIRLSNSFGIPKEDGSIVIDIPLKNQELANFCGTTRESVNRMLNSLRSDGIISINRGKITIHNVLYLRKEINCENCPIEFCTIE